MALIGLPPLWGWLFIGLALISFELLFIPGSYLLWVGLAALLMAVVAPFLVAYPATEWVVFGLFSLVFCLLGWFFFYKNQKGDAASQLNDPAANMLNKIYPLQTAIIDGNGQARVGDSVWRVTASQNLPAGAFVRVVGLDGATLMVEAVAEPDAVPKP